MVGRNYQEKEILISGEGEKEEKSKKKQTSSLFVGQPVTGG